MHSSKLHEDNEKSIHVCFGKQPYFSFARGCNTRVISEVQIQPTSKFELKKMCNTRAI